MPTDDQLLLNKYGEAFLRYVLAIPGESSISEGVQNANGAAIALLLEPIAINMQNGQKNVDKSQDFNIISRMSQYIPDFKMGLANYIRTICGGSVGHVPESGDPVLQSLRRLAHDLWPVYLLPSPINDGPQTFWMSSGPIGIFQHPEYFEFFRKFAADDDLKRLFPSYSNVGAKLDLTQLVDIHALWVLNLGSAGTTQMIGIVNNILFDSVIRAHLANGSLTHDGLMAELEVSISVVRKLANQQTVQVPAFIGLSGFQLKDGEQIDLPSGTIRCSTELERTWLLNGSHNVTAVFETKFPLQILDISIWDPSDDSFPSAFSTYAPQMEESRKLFQFGIDRMRLAVVLCSEDDEHLGAIEVSRYILNPMQRGGTPSWTIDQQIPASYAIHGSKFAEVIELYALIEAKHPDSLNISMKRLLSAVSQRNDPIDSFIDALIVWENVFGTKNETAFRVTGSLARLLEAGNLANRLELQKELGKLYNIRSRLVHGEKEPDPAKAREYRQRSIAIAIDCLRCLYKDRQDLLTMNSEDRSRILLLE